MTENFTCRAGRLLPKRGMIALGVGLIATAPIAIVTALLVGVYPIGTFAVYGLIFGGMLVTYGLGATQNARFAEGTLRVRDDDDAVTMDGAVLARRDELTQAFVVPTGASPFVRLERRRPRLPIVLRVPSEAEGHELIAALGFDAAHRAAEMKIATGCRARSARSARSTCRKATTGHPQRPASGPSGRGTAWRRPPAGSRIRVSVARDSPEGRFAGLLLLVLDGAGERILLRSWTCSSLGSPRALRTSRSSST